jgi:hypothetical protein
MAAIKKTVYFAFEPGERVWLVCDPTSSGVIRGYKLGLGFLPKYTVAFPNGKSTHIDHELTRDEPNPFQHSPEGDE